MSNSVMGKQGFWLGVSLAATALGIVAGRRARATRARQAWHWARGAALVTGASSGIGACFARRLAARKHDLLLVARREDRLKALAEELQAQHGVSVEVLVADLANASDVDLVARRVELLDDLELLVNNAGFGTRGRFAESDIDQQIDMVELHVVASMRLMRAALPGMISRHHGGIINVSSTAAFFPLSNSANYSATKAHLVNFTRALAPELRGTGVRAQALCPGFTHTEIHDHEGNGQPANLPGFLWMQAQDVVDESLDALERGEAVYVPGALNKVIAMVGSSGIAEPLLPLALR
jgi:uncharacterized protein